MKVLLALLSLLPSPQICSASLIEPSLAWSNPRVPVCFASPKQSAETPLRPEGHFPFLHFVESTPAERSEIQRVVQQNYSFAVTRIEYTGWEACGPRNSGFVHVFIADQANIGGLASAGMPKAKDKAPYVILRRLQNKAYFLSNAVHEFGHVAGLRHEHSRSEAHSDPHCDAISLTETPSKNALQVGPYDSESVMSYCFLDFSSHQSNFSPLHLSAGDIRTLREIYH